LAVYVEKSNIAKTGDYNLSGDRYRVATDYSNAKWPMVELSEVCELYQPKTITGKEISSEPQNGWYKVYGANGVIGYYHSYNEEYPEVLITCRGATCGTINLSDHKSYITGNAMVAKPKNSGQLRKKYLYHILKNIDFSSVITGAAQPQITRASLSPFQIPLPPLEIQEQIVSELDSYQKIIDGAKQIADNWKPKIDIDPKWEKMKIGNLCELFNGKAFRPNDWKKEESGGLPIIRIQNLNNEKAEFNYFNGEIDGQVIINNGDLLFSWSGSRGTSFGPHIWKGQKAILNQHIFKVVHKNNILKGFFYLMLKDAVKEVEENLHGGVGLVHITKGNLERIEIPLPSLEIQKQIVEKIEAERELVESAKKLIAIYEQKTKETIAKLWSE
jgi:restriction endonuclease S subunit